MEAKYYKKLPDRAVQCELCPHQCIINEGRKGKCKVRTNVRGTLNADNYQAIASVHLDPIEKKPLYHYYPGQQILSLGTVGCNFKCSCCQNFEISQVGVDGFFHFTEHTFDELVRLAGSKQDNIGVAYTYNEPSIWFEFIAKLAPKIQAEGMKNVIVSNGYISNAPLQELLGYIDAFNIDLKVFDEAGHHKFTGGELPYVKHSLKSIHKAHRHLELTHLVIPGVNDNVEHFKAMVHWIADALGVDVPLHLSRYFPRYKATADATPTDILLEFASYAKDHLSYVYLGNVGGADYQNTFCPKCGSLLIERGGYAISLDKIADDGSCGVCEHGIVQR